MPRPIKQLGIRLRQRWYLDKLDDLAERTGRARTSVATELLMTAIEKCYPDEGPIITEEDLPAERVREDHLLGFTFRSPPCQRPCQEPHSRRVQEAQSRIDVRPRVAA